MSGAIRWIVGLLLATTRCGSKATTTTRPQLLSQSATGSLRSLRHHACGRLFPGADAGRSVRSASAAARWSGTLTSDSVSRRARCSRRSIRPSSEPTESAANAAVNSAERFAPGLGRLQPADIIYPLLFRPPVPLIIQPRKACARPCWTRRKASRHRAHLHGVKSGAGGTPHKTRRSRASRAIRRPPLRLRSTVRATPSSRRRSNLLRRTEHGEIPLTLHLRSAIHAMASGKWRPSSTRKRGLCSVKVGVARHRNGAGAGHRQPVNRSGWSVWTAFRGRPARGLDHDPAADGGARLVEAEAYEDEALLIRILPDS